MRPPVIIIGAHRSGTTATARALELLGLRLGQELDSHRESKVLQRLHEEYLHRAAASWHHPQPFIDTIKESENARQECAAYLRSARDTRFGDLFGYRQNFRGWWLRREIKCGKAWGWKEPRTTLFARQWIQVFGGARIVHVLRHPLAVALSIRQRELRFRQAGDAPTPDLDRLDYCLQLALTYVREGDAVSEVTPNYFRLRFESLQNKRGNVLKVLASFAELDPTNVQLTRAAESIHASPPKWDALRPEDITTARSNESSLQQLGYELPPSARPTE